MSSNKKQRKKEIEIANSFEYGRSLLRAAEISLEEARSHKEKFHWAQVVHSSQRCIELSVKSIASFISETVTPVHELDDQTIMGLEARKSHELAHVNLTRLYIIQKLWATFYNESKYGKERYGLGPEKLFTELEAEFSIKHAETAEMEARRVFDYYSRLSTRKR